MLFFLFSKYKNHLFRGTMVLKYFEEFCVILFLLSIWFKFYNKIHFMFRLKNNYQHFSSFSRFSKVLSQKANWLNYRMVPTISLCHTETMNFRYSTIPTITNNQFYSTVPTVQQNRFSDNCLFG